MRFAAAFTIAFSVLMAVAVFAVFCVGVSWKALVGAAAVVYAVALVVGGWGSWRR